MDPRKNPYSPGPGTQPPELAGRVDLIEKAEIALDRCRNGLSSRGGLIMVGLRGVGKTILLTRICQDAEARGFATVFIETPEKRSLPASLIPALRSALIKLDRTEVAKDVIKKSLAILGGFVSAMKLKHGDIAGLLKREVQAVAPVRASLIKKGMIYSAAHGNNAFTVPLFQDYLKRVM